MRRRTPTRTPRPGAGRSAALTRLRGGTPPLTLRGRQELTRSFDRLELLEPGVVSPTLWRSDSIDIGGPVKEVAQFCSVGRKPWNAPVDKRDTPLASPSRARPLGWWSSIRTP
ncbi:MAG: SAM-dependent methyltransferase [Pseudonocardiaceae bacterium]